MNVNMNYRLTGAVTVILHSPFSRSRQATSDSVAL